MPIYRLQVKSNRRWKMVCDIEADSHRQAFQTAMLRISAEHYDKPIRLEQLKRRAVPRPKKA
jgi:hypothetical protein